MEKLSHRIDNSSTHSAVRQQWFLAVKFLNLSPRRKSFDETGFKKHDVTVTIDSAGALQMIVR